MSRVAASFHVVLANADTQHASGAALKQQIPGPFEGIAVGFKVIYNDHVLAFDATSLV
jgi:hypothetical protein